jgi:hypothetical protein
VSELTDVMSDPACLERLDGAQWDNLLKLARAAKVLARLHGYAQEREVLNEIPPAARDVLQGARIYADYRQLLARRELRELSHVFAECGYPVVLLKGAAYLLAELSPGIGRRLNDIDILVPYDKLAHTEALLQQAGWGFDEALTEYDERYYRDWSHEIPPLRRQDSPLELDVHHNLIQSSSRIKINADKLWAGLVAVPGTPFSVLAPTDMVLHSATHLFMSDELRGGLRDLVDIHMLCNHFMAQDSGYWMQLVSRAEELGVQRPLYYAASAMRRILGADVPDEAFAAIEKNRPWWLADKLMQGAIDRHLAPHSLAEMHSWYASNLLYLRSHWIRMPPLMLVRHLAYKWWVGRKAANNS